MSPEEDQKPMWLSSQTHDRGATTVTGTRGLQLPVPSQSGNAPIVWVDRSLLEELCGKADRAGSNVAAGHLAGYWVIPGTEAVITTWLSSEIMPTRRATAKGHVIGIWSTAPVAERPPGWPRALRRGLAGKAEFDPSATMLQLVLGKGTVWRPSFWVWSKRRWWIPRAVLGPRAGDVRLSAELKGA
jgi:hypothetical protein